MCDLPGFPSLSDAYLPDSEKTRGSKSNSSSPPPAPATPKLTDTDYRVMVAGGDGEEDRFFQSLAHARIFVPPSAPPGPIDPKVFMEVDPAEHGFPKDRCRVYKKQNSNYKVVTDKGKVFKSLGAARDYFAPPPPATWTVEAMSSDPTFSLVSDPTSLGFRSSDVIFSKVLPNSSPPSSITSPSPSSGTAATPSPAPVLPIVRVPQPPPTPYELLHEPHTPAAGMPILVLFHPSSWYAGKVVSSKPCYTTKGDTIMRYMLIVEFEGDGAREGVDVVVTKGIERGNRHTVFLGERREVPTDEETAKQVRVGR